MFESLSEKLHGVFERLGRKGRLSDEDVELALREVRVALLEADVSLKVVRQFVNGVKEKAVGQDVLHSLTPAQTVIKMVHKPLLVAADPYRPAAVAQLQTLGKQIEIPVYHEPNKKPPELAQAAVRY